jgi:hypothetical protein
MKKPIAAAAIAGSLLLGGGIGIALFGPSAANAQTPTDSSSSSGSTATAPKSNEDPTHEAGERASREADEDAGKVGGGHGHGSNEDPAHEATESSEREAQEGANAGSGATTAPAPSTATTPGT